jgi:hypothetical protein
MVFIHSVRQSPVTWHTAARTLRGRLIANAAPDTSKKTQTE